MGEDDEILAMLGAQAANLAVPETVATTQTFYRALWTRRASGIWTHLSRDTRAGLDRLAEKLDTNGRTLLHTQLFPKPNGKAGETLKVSLAALFLVRRPVSFEAVGQPGPDDDESAVLVANAQGEKRKVELRRERGEWRIHHPAFDELPPAIDLRPKLLPHDTQPEPEPGVDPEYEEPKPEAEQPEPAEPASPAPPETRPGPPIDPTRNPDLDF